MVTSFTPTYVWYAFAATNVPAPSFTKFILPPRTTVAFVMVRPFATSMRSSAVAFASEFVTLASG